MIHTSRNSPIIPDTKLVSKTIKELADHENRDENTMDAAEIDFKKKELFKTFQLLPPAKGPDPANRKGPNDKLLL